MNYLKLDPYLTLATIHEWNKKFLLMCLSIIERKYRYIYSSFKSLHVGGWIHENSRCRVHLFNVSKMSLYDLHCELLSLKLFCRNYTTALISDRKFKIGKCPSRKPFRFSHSENQHLLLLLRLVGNAVVVLLVHDHSCLLRS